MKHIKFNFICDNDDCQVTTPDLWFNTKDKKWLCKNCWWKYADISKKTIKRSNSMAKHLPKSKHYWHYMSYWLDKEETLTKDDK